MRRRGTRPHPNSGWVFVEWGADESADRKSGQVLPQHQPRKSLKPVDPYACSCRFTDFLSELSVSILAKEVHRSLCNDFLLSMQAQQLAENRQHEAVLRVRGAALQEQNEALSFTEKELQTEKVKLRCE